MNIVNFNKAVFEKNKLVIQDTITLDEWKELGQNLRQVEGSVQFWLGDWARFGDKQGFSNYTDPKVYDELEKITGLERDTIKKYKSVAERTSGTRIPDLEYSHHRAVAALPEDKQREYLQRAVDEGMSVRDLTLEIKTNEGAAVISSGQEKHEAMEAAHRIGERLDEEKRITELIKEINSMKPSQRLKIKNAIKA